MGHSRTDDKRYPRDRFRRKMDGSGPVAVESFLLFGCYCASRGTSISGVHTHAAARYYQIRSDNCDSLRVDVCDDACAISVVYKDRREHSGVLPEQFLLAGDYVCVAFPVLRPVPEI